MDATAAGRACRSERRKVAAVACSGAAPGPVRPISRTRRSASPASAPPLRESAAQSPQHAPSWLSRGEYPAQMADGRISPVGRAPVTVLSSYPWYSAPQKYNTTSSAEKRYADTWPKADSIALIMTHLRHRPRSAS